MGVDTKLYIKNDIDFQTIRRLLEHLPEIAGVTFTPSHEPDYTTIEIGVTTSHVWDDGEPIKSRRIHFHRNASTPIGKATVLTLRANDHAIEFFKAIAAKIGGILQPTDCEEKYEFIFGMTFDEDGIPYLLNSAIVEGAMVSNNDIDGLVNYIKANR